MQRLIISGLICLILGVILGAFGAHGLKSQTSDSIIIDSFETGVKYQIYTGFFFIIAGLLSQHVNNFKDKLVFVFLLLGVVLFSGSIYGLTFAKLNDFILLRKICGPITPIGGLLIILGLLQMLISLILHKK